MHILEKYALESLSKIDKPYIFQKFFPIPFDKYICFQSENKNRQKYLYWQDVIDIIHPFLEEKKIKIVQLDGTQINRCLYVGNQIDFNNKAYIIKNSILYFGVEGFASQVASSFNKKIVSVYGDFPPENKKGYWSKADEEKSLYKKNEAKPSYNLDTCNDINNIRPEDIAKNILDLLNIKYKNMIKTHYIGRSYVDKTFEIIPDGLIQTPENIPNLIIRMDYFYDEKFLSYFLSQKKCTIVTDKSINLELLEAYKSNILNIIYIISEDNDEKFVEDIKNIGLHYDMISYLDDKDLNKFKLKYIDLGLIYLKNKEKFPQIKLDKNELLLFKSSKILASKDGLFLTKYHWKNKISINETPLFTENIDQNDLENLYIYSIDR